MEAGGLLRALAPVLWTARAVGLLTYRLRPRPPSGPAPAPAFALCKASAAYAALLCGWVSAVIVYCALDYNAKMEAWSHGQQVGEAALWAEGPAPEWLPLLKFKVNFNFAAFLLAVPLLQAAALRAQPRWAALLGRAAALEAALGAAAAARARAALARRARRRLVGLCAALGALLASNALVSAPVSTAALVALCSANAAVICVAGVVVHVLFDAGAFFVRRAIAHGNRSLRLWAAALDARRRPRERGTEAAAAAAAAGGVGAAEARATGRLLARAGDAAHLLARAFSPLLLLLVLLHYANIACLLYYLAVSLLYPPRDAALLAMWSAHTCAWLAMHVAELLLLVRSAQGVVREAEKSPPLVHSLLLSSEDNLLRQELQLLSLQTLHRHVKFSACGFFTLDFSLLCSLFGAVSTYLIILIQIQLSLGPTNKF